MTTQDYRTRSPLRIFLSYFKPHWKLFTLDISCAVLIAMVDLAFPLISRTALYHWLPEKNYRVFFIAMAVVALAFVLRAGLYYIVTYWGHTFGIRVEADIRRDLFHHMQALGFDFYDRNRTGQLMSRLTTDLFELTELAHHGPEDLTISVITIVGALAVMFRIEWRMAILIMVIIPIFLVVLLLLRGGMSRASVAAKQKTGAINAEIESGLSGIRTVKAFGNERIQQQRFDCANETFKTAKRGFHKEMGRFNATMELFVTLLNVAVIAGGGWLMMGGRMDYVDLITFSLYITTFITPVRKLTNFAELFSNGFAGLHRFIELMGTEPAITDAPDAAAMPSVMVMVAVPEPTRSTVPPSETFTTLVLELFHVAVPVTPSSVSSQAGSPLLTVMSNWPSGFLSRYVPYMVLIFRFFREVLVLVLPLLGLFVVSGLLVSGLLVVVPLSGVLVVVSAFFCTVMAQATLSSPQVTVTTALPSVRAETVPSSDTFSTPESLVIH